MSVPAAYITVVLVWSTTPLGIVWSSESVHPTMAVFMRMLIALVLGFTLIKLWRVPLPWHKPALKLYAYSSLGLTIGMLLSYLSSRYIPSALMSLAFGLTPLMSGLLAQKILAENKFTKLQTLALLISVMGLAIICIDKIYISEQAWIGIVLVLLAVFAFSLSSVMVKSVEIDIHPFATTVGALILTTPFYAIVWWVFDGNLNTNEWQTKSLASILYLGIFGSLIGFVAYFFILQKLSASTVALTTLITPIAAMMLGASLNDEHINEYFISGAFGVLFGLGLYQFADKINFKWLKREEIKELK